MVLLLSSVLVGKVAFLLLSHPPALAGSCRDTVTPL